MAYFPSGSEGMAYESQYCDNCRHGSKDGCPVMMAHFEFAYQLCNRKEDPGKKILDRLIPMNGLYAGRCSMFIARCTPTGVLEDGR